MLALEGDSLTGEGGRWARVPAWGQALKIETSEPGEGMLRTASFYLNDGGGPGYWLGSPVHEGQADELAAGRFAIGADGGDLMSLKDLGGGRTKFNALPDGESFILVNADGGTFTLIPR